MHFTTAQRATKHLGYFFYKISCHEIPKTTNLVTTMLLHATVSIKSFDNMNWARCINKPFPFFFLPITKRNEISKILTDVKCLNLSLLFGLSKCFEIGFWQVKGLNIVLRALICHFGCFGQHSLSWGFPAKLEGRKLPAKD